MNVPDGELAEGGTTVRASPSLLEEDEGSVVSEE
jgi:hypothetical protein